MFVGGNTKQLPTLPSFTFLMTTFAKKRRYTEAELLQDDSSLLSSKRFKPSSTFWDNLFKISLTCSALEKLKQRYTLFDQSCVQLKVKQPHTQSTVCEFKQKSQLTVPVFEYLLKASQADVTQLKFFAKQGGSDLINLRGVCTIQYHFSVHCWHLFLVFQAYHELKSV